MKTLFAASLLALAALPAAATTVLYSQDFENPVNFVNDGGDINIYRTVNQLYGNQPPGFQFYQNYTTETLLVGGNSAFGTGYKDPQARAGKYVLGLLSDAQNDLLGLSFNVGSFKFLNFQLDISSIDLDRFGGPFVSPGLVPAFRLSLYDNPGGAVGLGSGSLLDFEDITGLAGVNDYTFNWSNFTVALDASGTTSGNVTLRIDLLRGGYAAMDNFRIAASDDPGDTGTVPEPATLALSGLALAALLATRRRR